MHGNRVGNRLTVGTITLFGILALSVPAAAYADGTDAVPASSVQVRAFPASTVAGGTIAILGTTALDAGDAPVKITIKSPPANAPQAAPIQLSARPEKNGDFKVSFSQTAASGTYMVQAFSPSGRYNAMTTFTVSPLANSLSDAQAELDRLKELAGKAEATAEQLLKTLPESPPKQILQEKLDTLKMRMDQESQQISKLSPVLQRIRIQASKSPDAAVIFMPVFTLVSSWQTYSAAERVKINEELIQNKAAGVRCEALDKLIESLNLLAFVFNLTDAPFKIMVEFCKDVDSNHAASLVKDPGQQFAITEIVKTIPETFAGPIGWAKAVIDITVDASAYVAQNEFAHYCEKFEGPFSATMNARFEKNGRAWWKYSTEIKGRLVLRYPKTDQPGAAIHLTGHFEGHATNFTIAEEAISVLYPKLMSGAMIYHRATPPIAGSNEGGEGAKLLKSLFLEGQGRIASLLDPYSFLIPVEGDLVGKKLTLRIQEATKDFPAALAKAHVVYVIGSVLSLVPVVTSFDLPYKDAHFIIVRAFGDPPGELQFTVDKEKKVSLLSGTFARSKNNGDNSVQGQYTLTVKATNP